MDADYYAGLYDEPEYEDDDQPSSCKFCGALICWDITENGKFRPVTSINGTPHFCAKRKTADAKKALSLLPNL